MRKWALPLALLAALWPLSTAWAIEQPDTFNILSARAYGSAIESGDLLVVVHYDIDYASLPSETATQAFLSWYYDASSTPAQRISSSPYLYVRSGYGQGVMSLYLTAANVSAWGITWGDADSAQITGNPALFAAPKTFKRALEWRVQTSPADTLEGDLRTVAGLLEGQSEWSGVDLISGTTLTSTGADYLTNAVVNLRTMAPGLFDASLGNPDFTERDHQTSYADSLDGFWAGSALANNWINLADWFNVPVQMLQTMVVLAIAIAAGAWVVNMTGESLAILPVTGIVLVAGTLISWVPLEFTAMAGFMGLVVIAFSLFLKRATA